MEPYGFSSPDCPLFYRHDVASLNPTDICDDPLFAEPFPEALMTTEVNLSLRVSQMVHAPAPPLGTSGSVPLPSPLSSSQPTERPLKRSRDKDPAIEDPAVEDPAMQEPSRKKARKSRDTTERPDEEFVITSRDPSDDESLQTSYKKLTPKKLTPDQYDSLTPQQLKALPPTLGKKVQNALSARRSRQRKKDDEIIQISAAWAQYQQAFPQASLQCKSTAWSKIDIRNERMRRELAEIFTDIASDVSSLGRENAKLRDRIKKLEAAFQQ